MSIDRVPTARPLAPMAARFHQPPPGIALLGLVLFGAAACGDNDDDLGFQSVTSSFSVDEGAGVRVVGTYALAFADESAGALPADLNQDSDMDDAVVIAVDVTDGAEFNSGAAAREAEALGTDLFLVVDEANNIDWNSDGVDDTVLLRWDPGEGGPEFVATLVADSSVIVSGGRLWFSSPDLLASADETALRYIDASAPEVVETLFSAADTTGTVVPEIFDEQDGLLILTLDETVNGDQNADFDTADTRVMAFVEAASLNPLLLTSSLAAPAAGQIIQVRLTEPAVWDIALLVSEQAQNENLNGLLLQPVQCSSGVDTDLDENILHVARFELGALSEFTNTELPGATNPAANRILLTAEAVGLSSQESGYGPAPGCDLNGDTDFDDLIWRWAPLDDLTNAETAQDLMRSINPALPGGARGVIALGGNFVVAETQLVPNPETPELLARLGWVDPVDGTAYEESFFDPDDLDNSNPIVVAVDWMDEEPQGGLAPIGALEGPTGFNLNNGCNGVTKDSGSADLTDTLAAWLLFSPSRDAMLLAGRGYSLQPANPGITFAASQSFFRVSESEDGFDWNGDNDLDDTILFRVPLTNCDPDNMGVLNTLSGEPAVTSDGLFGAAFFADESIVNSDLNDDGVIGFALRTFSF